MLDSLVVFFLPTFQMFHSLIHCRESLSRLVLQGINPLIRRRKSLPHLLL